MKADSKSLLYAWHACSADEGAYASQKGKRSFAWSGGKMSTNREEATEAFLERVSRGETAELSAEQRAAIARVADS